MSEQPPNRKPGQKPGQKQENDPGNPPPLQEEATSVPARVELSPDNIEQGLAKLVLTLIDFLRQLLERQAIRRMEGGDLSEEEIEQMGEALMKLEAKIREMAEQFGLSPADLNIDLGPLGRLR